MNTKKYMLFVLLDGFMLLSYTNKNIEIVQDFSSKYYVDKYTKSHKKLSYTVGHKDLTRDEMELEVASLNMYM